MSFLVLALVFVLDLGGVHVCFPLMADIKGYGYQNRFASGRLLAVAAEIKSERQCFAKLCETDGLIMRSRLNLARFQDMTRTQPIQTLRQRVFSAVLLCLFSCLYLYASMRFMPRINRAGGLENIAYRAGGLVNIAYRAVRSA